jgi:ADP-heptose:LPS heptosyltransferase/GT2 family glycosyltransferase
MAEGLSVESLLNGTISWERLDTAFYAAVALPGQEAAEPGVLIAHYLGTGARAGLSPNRWFDEAFYRAQYPDVAALLEDGQVLCGFDHYRREGHPDRAPHWLFDPALYARENPSLTPETLQRNGFANLYDHYVKFGQAERRRAHGFFDPGHYLAALPEALADDAAAEGAYRHFLRHGWRDGAADRPEPATSPQFDPAWYRATQPGVAEALATGAWHGALHHYLAEGRQRGLAARPQIKIHVDRPRHRKGLAQEPVVGHLDILGWAAANHRIRSVEVRVDGTTLGRAHHGIRTEGVAAAFPELTHSLFAGFHFIGGAALSPGRHRVEVVATGETGLVETEAFDVEFEELPPTEGPWSLRRRMRHSEIRFKRDALRRAGVAPVFHVVIGQSGSDDAALRRTLRSLQRQAYPQWRLQEATPLAPAEPDGADLWLVRLNAGDELGVDALLELALHRLDDPRCDFVYSDERREDPTTGTVEPWFKPDWSPDLLLAMNYVGRLWAVAQPVAARAGLDAAALALAEDYDAVLRLTEHASRIGHVPRVLCESRPLAESDRAGEQASLTAAVRRRGLDAAVETGRVAGTWQVRRAAPADIRVSVIIPTAGVGGLIETALRTLRATTDASRVEVIVIDTAPETGPAPWRETVQALADRIVEDRRPFNWSRVNNQGALRATGELLLFLNDDIACVEPGWLEAMLAHVVRPEIGVVGARLLYPGGTHVQHAGIVLTQAGGRHLFHGSDAGAAGPFGLAQVERNVSAVTGACLMVRGQLFKRLGGFDERLAIVGNDVDLCLRCGEIGLRNLIAPAATLAHHESPSRTGLPEDADLALFQEIWRRLLWRTDPYSNPNIATGYSDHRPEPEYCEVLHAGRPLAPAAEIRRILIVKLDHIGDFILAVPALRRLRRHFAKSHITLLIAPALAGVALEEKLADEIITFTFFSPRSADGLHPVSEEDYAALAAQLASQAFDLAIDFRIGDETRPLLLLSGATWHAGFEGRTRFPWLDIVAVSEADVARSGKRTHAADTLDDFAAKIVADFTAQSDAAADRPDARAQGERVLIAIHPAAGNPVKQWGPGAFVTLIDQLCAAGDCTIVLVGSEDDADLAREILLGAADVSRILSAVGRTTLTELAALLAGCALMIGNDSGPQHMAAHLGVPTIGLHSGVVDAREWGPAGPVALAIRRRMVCSPCYIAKSEDCPREIACLSGITPREVFDLAMTLLPATR